MTRKVTVICLDKKCPAWTDGGVCKKEKIEIINGTCAGRSGMVVHSADEIFPAEWKGKNLEVWCNSGCGREENHSCQLNQIVLSRCGICREMK